MSLTTALKGISLSLYLWVLICCDEMREWFLMAEGSEYLLVCRECGAEYGDDGLRLCCDRPHADSLLRTRFAPLVLGPAAPGPRGLSAYAPWLPVARAPRQGVGPVAFRAGRLGRRIGLRELWVTFTGHWPERGARSLTGSFKDLEACTVLGRLPERAPVLVVASAGNTAAAFARACSEADVPCLLIVPGLALPRLEAAGPRARCVTLVAVDGPAGYDDAIALAARVARLPGFQAEGGIRNVARRDGLATCLLAGAAELGALPAHYVQGVGSGTGAVAAHEAAVRLRDGGCPDPLPRLLLCQNSPRAPLFDLWLADRGAAAGAAGAFGAVGRAAGRGPTGRAAADPDEAEPLASELTNGAPPYAVRGGVRDALDESGGRVLAVSNRAAREAMALFEGCEGIDIEPGAGVALAGLRAAVREGRIGAQETVLLNVTGGGRARLRAASPPGRRCVPDAWVPVERVRDAVGIEAAAEAVAETARRSGRAAVG